MGVGTCYLDFDGAMMPERKPHFYDIQVPIRDLFLTLDVLTKFLSSF